MPRGCDVPLQIDSYNCDDLLLLVRVVNGIVSPALPNRDPAVGGVVASPVDVNLFLPDSHVASAPARLPTSFDERPTKHLALNPRPPNLLHLLVLRELNHLTNC